VLSVRGLCDVPIPVQRTPTECDVSEYDIETSTVRRPRTKYGCCTKINSVNVIYGNNRGTPYGRNVEYLNVRPVSI